MGRNAGRDKVAYICISQDPAKAGPTLGVVVVVVGIIMVYCVSHSGEYKPFVSPNFVPFNIL